MNKQSNRRHKGAGQVEFHPLASVDPVIDGAEYAALIADIRKNGLLEPIILYQGKILDGRNRYRACLEADVEPRLHEMHFQGDAYALAYLDSANLHRRHLTPKQKRDRIAARLKADPSVSDRQLAKQTGSSHPHVAKVRRQMEQAGDVETVSTSRDTKGRKQPRQRSKPAAKPSTTKPTEPPTIAKVEPVTASRGNNGPYSDGEHDRLRARVEELSADKRRLEIKVVGLESEVAELTEKSDDKPALEILGAALTVLDDVRNWYLTNDADRKREAAITALVQFIDMVKREDLPIPGFLRRVAS